jgi:hypothetical protein
VIFSLVLIPNSKNESKVSQKYFLYFFGALDQAVHQTTVLKTLPNLPMHMHMLDIAFTRLIDKFSDQLIVCCQP